MYRYVLLIFLLHWFPAQALEIKVRDAGALYYENVPPVTEEVRRSLYPYLDIRSARFAGWLPGGGMLIRTRMEETEQVYRVSEPGGRREQLTFFHDPVQFARASGDPQRNLALLLRDEGGSEDFQLFSLDLDSGDTRLISAGEARTGAVVISRAGDRAAYYSTRRNGRDWDLYVADLATGEERMVHEAEGIWMPLEWGPRDRSLLVLHVVSNAESYPWLLDLRSGRIRRLTREGHVAAYRSLRFGRSPSELVLISDAGREFMSLYAVDLRSGRRRLLLDESADVTEIEVSPDGRVIAYVINHEGFGRLRLFDLQSGQHQALPDLPEGVISNPTFSPDGRLLAFDFTGPAVAGDVFVLEPETGELQRWTYSESGGLSETDFIEPELFHYPTFDRVDDEPRRIPAWLYRPRGEGPHPVIVEIHGGPAVQRRPTFSASFQHWANELGAAVIAPNVRGSTGYGATYVGLDDGRRREDAVRDIGALLDWIAGRPDLDEERVAVYGSSYGGYMVLASMMYYGDRLAAGVNIVGIGNFVTFLENTRDYRRELRRAEYGDERDPEMRAFLESISPARHPQRLTRPLLVIQGLNDPRVPVSESEKLIAAMRENGHNPWYLLARNEGHGFRRLSNRRAMDEAVTLFFRRYLLGLDET